MKKHKTSSDFYEGSKVLETGKINLLEMVLKDAKPIVQSTNGVKYDLVARPTELSSGGYIDSPGT